MRLNNFISFAGFVILIAATYCPILRPFHLFNWNVYDADKPYGIIILLVAVVGIIGTVFNQSKIIRLAAWLSVLLVALLYLMAQLKVHTSFSFIPFHSIENFLSRQIKFKWGWFLLFGGALLALLGALLSKKPNRR
jgi:predicted membrane channel-forming protein YqfA (hemolysin III family)